MTTVDAESTDSQSSIRPTIALSGIVVAFAILNSLAVWHNPDTSAAFSFVLAYGLLGIEPIVFGLWTALGSGSIFKRLPVAVPCLFLVFIAPGYIPRVFADTRRYEFIMLVLMGFAVYVVVTLLFLLFRWFTRFRIQSLKCEPNSGVKFSIRELLILITLYAVAMGMAAQLKFNTKPEYPNLILGPDIYFEIALLGGSALAAVVLPTAAVPLAILHGHPTRFATMIAVAFWAVVTIATCFFFVEKVDDLLELWPLPLVQLIAASIGAIMAICLRWSGLRLVRPPRLSTQPPAATS